ncbi:hypothetical protein ACFQMA_14060 [Halosimplex aquaticum]|uniref:Uncharacterized protein n=1 Tax=Halosimplex aquaticum TaxID=3026162 RepID=A0ABD5Y5C7_9EURY|nr:hypothetical protein [Halosimplex aquaticum]
MVGERPEGGESMPGEQGTERPESGRAAFLAALRVRRNAKWGLAVGVAVALGAFFLFVVLLDARDSPLWYVALGFTLAMSTAGLVAFLLTLGRAVRLSREL